MAAFILVMAGLDILSRKRQAQKRKQGRIAYHDHVKGGAK